MRTSEFDRSKNIKGSHHLQNERIVSFWAAEDTSTPLGFGVRSDSSGNQKLPRKPQEIYEICKLDDVRKFFALPDLRRW